MYVREIATLGGLEGLRAGWNALAGGVPFRMHQWLHPWWRHYGAKRRLMVLAVYDERDALVGIAPWYVENSTAKGRVIRPLGSGEVCSDYLSILVRPEREQAVLAALADYLCDARQAAWDLLELPAVDGQDRVVPQLAAALADGEHTVHRREAHRCWRVELPGTWEDYVALQSKSHRKQLRRFQTRVLESGRAVLHQAHDARSLDRGWRVLVDLHQRRRASLGEPGCFASSAFTAFQREAAAAMLAAGCLRLWWLEVDGRPIAAEYQLASSGVTYAYQSGVEPERLDEEPGRVITIATIQQAIAEGQRGYDFLRGDEPYKAHWRAQPRPAYDYRIASSRAMARLRHHAWLAAEGVKGWIKEGLMK